MLMHTCRLSLNESSFDAVRTSGIVLAFEKTTFIAGPKCVGCLPDYCFSGHRRGGRSLETLRPIYRTGVKLPSRCPILYLFNKYPY